MNIQEQNIDLFEFLEENPNYSTAHCISSDCRMGAGIALDFHKTFPSMKQNLLNKVEPSHVGKCLEYKIPNENMFVFNLITKRVFRDKPSYRSLENSLVDMKQQMIKRNVTNLVIPRIGSGLDRLNWFKVKRIIQKLFKEEKFNIVVCYF